jgi:succinate dehydrogenase / fumarate reductase flavoprotein subunit
MPPTIRTSISNVLVIGSGAAGLRAAIAAHEAGAEVTIVGKRGARDAHSVLAAGGINAALGTVDPEDSWQQHFADTMIEGYLLSDPRVVEIMAANAPVAVEELAAWGCDFARLPDGRIDQRFFGAHTWRRTAYAGDWTGRAIVRTLGRRVVDVGIPVVEHTYVTELLVRDGTCFGAFAFDLRSGERTAFLADAVILAAGGHTRLWRRSSSRRDENYGNGMAMALRAGARLADMELVQFHPTGMVTPEEMAGTLVTEAVRGEGGKLYNADGERYMERYDPERMELSTRDRVALANYTEIAEGRGTPNGGVLLDISHVDKDTIVEKLPRMYRQFLDSQLLDISTTAMEVAPTAHYSMGGVEVEPATHGTDVDGLYAVGEVTAGLHGANRLGGNSLAETVVFGKIAGDHAALRSRELTSSLRGPQEIHEANDRVERVIRPGSEFARPLQRAIRDTMWERCGVVRSDEGLRAGLDELAEIQRAAEDLDVRPSSEGYADLAHAFDLQAGLLTARATILGALARTETRGAHNRSDHPDLDPQLTVNHVVSLDVGTELEVGAKPVFPVRDDLRSYLEATDALPVAGRLLE